MAACEIRILTEDDWALWREVRLRSLIDAPDAFGSKLADWQGINDREDRWRCPVRAGRIRARGSEP